MDNRKMPTTSMGPVSPSSGMILTVKIHKDRYGHVIMKDPTPFLSPLSSVGSSSPSSSPSDNLKQVESQQAVYICERSPMINKINFESDDLSTCTHKEYEEEELENKAVTILNCLSGIIPSRKSPQEVKLVDLWHLRQLALTPGGLINASIRKRGWLKLVDANDHIFTTSADLPWNAKRMKNDFSSVVSLSDEEIVLIQADIEQCKWDIENLIKLSRKIRRQQKRTGKNVGYILDGDTDSISNVSLGSGLTSNGRITPQMIPESIRAFPRIGAHSGDRFSPPTFHFPNPSLDQEPIQSTDKGTFSIAEEETLSQDPPQSIGKRSLSKEERSLLLNIIFSVLREIPDNAILDESEESKRLYYFQGMYNIAAVLLITLESPSLSSLAMKKLSKFHFRDYCAPTFMNTQAAIRIIFMPLLKELDPLFHQTLLDKGIHDVCGFVLPWIICWYANDILEYDIICRLFDVFLASHALLPVYMAVAFVTHPWSKAELDRDIGEGDEFMSTLASIPSNMVSSQSQSSASFCIEQVISCALTSIRDYTPDKLVTIAKRYHDDQVVSSAELKDSIIHFQEPPQWAYKASANTDWTLIQEARKLREASPNSRETKKREFYARTNVLTAITQDRFHFDLALDAAGLNDSTRSFVVQLSKSRRATCNMHIMRALFAFSCIMAMSFLWTTSDMRTMDAFVSPRKEHHVVNDVTEVTLLNRNCSIEPKENNSNPVAVQPILHSTKFETLLWTLPFTCDDSWCAVPDQIFGDIDLRTTFTMKSKTMEAFVSFVRQLIQDDPDCFFFML